MKFEYQIWYLKESHQNFSASRASMQSVKEVLRSPFQELLRTFLTDSKDPVEAELHLSSRLYGDFNLHCKFQIISNFSPVNLALRESLSASNDAIDTSKPFIFSIVLCWDVFKVVSISFFCVITSFNCAQSNEATSFSCCKWSLSWPKSASASDLKLAINAEFFCIS